MEICDCLGCCSSIYHPRDESADKELENDPSKLSYVGLAAYDVLRRQHYRHHHTCWNISSGRVVGEVHQTPRHGWLRVIEYPPEGHDDWFPEKLAEIISRTEYWCDIMSLSPPDGIFMRKFQEAIQAIAEKAEGKERPVIVRIMFGNIVGFPVNCNKVIKVLTDFVSPKANIRLWVGSWRRSVSWNHAKIIAIDGKYLHTGGHNLWEHHYLKHNPVHDLSFELEGLIAHDAHRFANEQWAFIQYKQDTFCGQFVDKLPDDMILLAKTRVTISEFPRRVASEFAPMYEKQLVPKYEPLSDAVPLISLGRIGTILKHARPSDDAFMAMFGAAKHSIRMALQDIGPVCVPHTKVPIIGSVWPRKYLNAIGRALWVKNVMVEIALSNPMSIPGGLALVDGFYGNGWSCGDVAAEIIKTIRKQFPEATDAQLRTKITERLKVCFIREARGNKYDDGMTMGMHAKHFVIDGRCAYIGSQNLYSCDLAEWGVVVDDEAATKKIMKEYWIPMWQVSYKEEDCNVQEIMDGLDINRDGQTPLFVSDDDIQQMRRASQMQMHAHSYMNFFDEESGRDRLERRTSLPVFKQPKVKRLNRSSRF